MKNHRCFQRLFNFLLRPTLACFPEGSRRRRTRERYHPAGRAARILGSLAALVLSLPVSAVSFHGLGDLPGGAFNSEIHGVSANGKVVVGTSDFDRDKSAPFRWTESDGMGSLGLGANLGTRFAGRDVSADGAEPPPDAADNLEAPERLLQELLETAHRGDLAEFTKRLSENSRPALAQLYADRKGLADAQADYQAALDERFGKGTAVQSLPAVEPQTVLARLADLKLLAAKRRPAGGFELQVQTSSRDTRGKILTEESALVATEEGGRLRLVLTPLIQSGEKVATEREAVIKAVTGDIRAGKYKDRLAAMMALARLEARPQKTGDGL